MELAYLLPTSAPKASPSPTTAELTQPTTTLHQNPFGSSHDPSHPPRPPNFKPPHPDIRISRHGPPQNNQQPRPLLLGPNLLASPLLLPRPPPPPANNPRLPPHHLHANNKTLPRNRLLPLPAILLL